MTHTNRLIHASSPYLLQHAHNPVDWWEWCDEAFEKARMENKLVLVSIGYSACHWCHVMERECFEKEDTARIMNTHFVCIKVDREERPDVDQIYMDAVQLLTGSGGWPLNCFTLPDGRPLHGGTYFPKANWEQTLLSLATFYRDNQEEAFNYATQLTNGVKRINLIEGKSDTLMSKEQISEVLHKWAEQFDLMYGGFNRAPKFPMPVNLELFLQYASLTGEEQYAEWVHTTLMHMANGGIYDQSGGGFARYSTDALWHAPHFEKMLYDNAQLVSMYTKAYADTKHIRYKEVVEQTLAFIERELTSPEGLFYAALDADSEGVEGKFYCWTKSELEALLGKDEPVFSLYYSVEPNGNWEHAMNILYRTKSDTEIESLTGMKADEVRQVMDRCHTLLMREREKRIRPGLDDKIIASWNAMMIKGYAEASLVFGNKTWLDTAEHAMKAMLDFMHRHKQLFRIFKNGKASIAAFSEDYALLCDALLALYEASGKEDYALLARDFASEAGDHFYDATSGFYLFTSKYQPQLVAGRADVNDDVIPSSNGVMAKVLYRIGFLFDDEKAFARADDMLERMQGKMKQYPALYPNWFSFLLWKQHGLYQLVVKGQGATNPVRDYFPQLICCVAEGESRLPLLKEKADKGGVTYYLCKDRTCGLPATDMEQVWEGME